jgi:hypothetical protein
VRRRRRQRPPPLQAGGDSCSTGARGRPDAAEEAAEAEADDFVIVQSPPARAEVTEGASSQADVMPTVAETPR